MEAFIKGMRASFVVLAIAALAACATGAGRDAMTAGVSPAIVQAMPQPLRGQVALKDVIGGRETNAMLKSNISSAEFQSALDASLRNAGLAASDPNSARYELAATIQEVNQPILGFDMTVTATVHYDLIERATRKTAWEKTITLPYTAKMGDAFLGSERLRLANEGAGRVNIEGFLGELAKTGPRAP